MRTHKVNAVVTEKRELKLHLPDDFPPGPVEVVIISGTSGAAQKADDSPSDFDGFIDSLVEQPRR